MPTSSLPLARLRSRARGALVIALLVTAGAAACAPDMEPAHEEQLSASSTYAVIEIRPVQGEATTGATSHVRHEPGPIRVRTLDFVPESPRAETLADEGFPGGPWCIKCRQRPGRIPFDGRLVNAFPVDSAWQPGEVRRIRRRSFEYRNAYDVLLLAVRGTEERPAEIEARLLKRCRTPVFYREESVPVYHSGIIEVPKGSERFYWVEGAPPCYAAGDHEEIAETPAEVARREFLRDSMQDADTAARAARERDALARQEERFAGYEREATRHYVPTGDHVLNAAERLLNPRTAGLMTAAGIRRLEIVRKCASYRTRTTVPRHRYCNGYQPVLRVIWDGGGSTWVDHPDDLRWATAWRGVTLFGGVLRLEPPVVSGATAFGQRMGLRDSAPTWPPELAARAEEAVRFAARSLKRPGDPDARALPSPAGWSLLLGPGQRHGDEDDWMDVTPE